MTIADLPPVIEYMEDGTTLAFPVPYRFFDGDDLIVERMVGAVVTVLAIGANYSVTGGETDAGGTVTLTSTVAGASLAIRRHTPRTQQSDYQTGDAFPSETAEGDWDKAIALIQEIDQAEIGFQADFDARALKVPPGETVADLPALAARAGAYLAFDPAGNPVPASGTGADGALRADLAGPNGAALVGFLQAGLGALLRTAQAKMRERVSVLDFGADPTGVADSTAAIQAAIDWATYQNLASGLGGFCKVHVPGGIYMVSDTIHLGYGTDFRSVHIEGDGQRYRASSQFAGTAIVATFNDRPVFAVSGGRATTIRGMWIQGLNYNWVVNNNLGTINTPLVNDLVAANWVDPSLPAAASSRYAPYCAIAVDPYAGPQPAVHYPTVTYPAWLGAVAQYNKVFSSATKIADVGISGFVVALANQPSDADGNGDFTNMDRCSIECCQYGISIGNAQSRVFKFSQGVIGQVHTALVTGINGKQRGKPSMHLANNDISNSIYIFNIPSMSFGGAGFKLENIYSEALYSLGTTAGGGSTGVMAITGCEFNFYWTPRGVAPFVLSARNNTGVRIADTSFTGIFGANYANVYHFDGNPTMFHFDNCFIYAGASATLYSEKHVVNATCGITFSQASTRFAKFNVRPYTQFNLNSGAALTQALGIIDTAYVANRSTCFPVYARAVAQTNLAGEDPGFAFKAENAVYNKANAASVSASGRTVTLDLTGSGANANLLRQGGGEVGDFAVDDVTNTVFVITARTGLVLTMIAQNGFDASGNLLTAITLAGNLWCVNCRRYTFHYVTLGDTTSGNAVISNVQRPDTFATYIDDPAQGVQVGDCLYVGSGAVFQPTSPSGGIVNAVDHTAKTITLNSTMNVTAAKQRLTLFIRAAPANNT